MSKENKSNSSSLFEKEQKNVDKIFHCFDITKENAEIKLEKFKKNGGSETHQGRAERDSLASMYFNRINQLNYVENRLVFGKLQYIDGKKQYIGRIGISDENGNPVLTDWRAPSAQTFYRATLQENENVAIRRHIGLEKRTVASIEDEVLSFDSSTSKAQIKENDVAGEEALFMRLSENKSSQMKDILSTIQREQDRIIRSNADIVVIQGGPGTGKTAVALHRVAYLLYTKKEELGKKGVLVIGPNKSFLHYIDKVIPSLGETGVVSATIPTLLPNIHVTRKESILERRIKGDRRMVEVIKKAIEYRIYIPDKDIDFNFESNTYTIERDFILKTIKEVKKLDLPHNKGRGRFVEKMLNYLVDKVIATKRGLYNEEQKKIVKSNLIDSHLLKVILNIIWMPITKERLIGELWSKPNKLKEIAGDLLTDDEIKVLTQPVLAPWSASDIPLLDEAHHLLGELNKNNKERGIRGDSSNPIYSEIADFTHYMLDNSYLPKFEEQEIQQYFENEMLFADIKERARLDVDWNYGHIVVDEAQELTYMDWRMLKRRCPSQSFTIVGDVSQKSDSPQDFSWKNIITRVFTKEFTLEHLTINYRNPVKIASLAANFAKENNLFINQTNCGREVENSLVYKKFKAEDINKEVGAIACELLNKTIDEHINGRVAVICSKNRVADAIDAFYEQAIERLYNPLKKLIESQDQYDSSIIIDTPTQTKGLEFDAVVLVEPQDFLDGKKSKFTWLSNIFVAITRATKQLIIVHSKDLPRGLEQQ